MLREIGFGIGLVVLLVLGTAFPVGAAEVDGKVLLGIDVLLRDYLHLVQGKRVGLVTHAAAVDSQLRNTADVLHAHPEVDLRALFAPSTVSAARPTACTLRPTPTPSPAYCLQFVRVEQEAHARVPA